MKNVKIAPPSGMRGLSIPIPGAPPPHGWAVKLVQDLPDANYKHGYWMATWQKTPESWKFSFDPAPNMAFVFSTEPDAKKVSDFLRKQGEIETEVVKVGNP
jgi:hypothetical protein